MSRPRPGTLFRIAVPPLGFCVGKAIRPYLLAVYDKMYEFAPATALGQVSQDSILFVVAVHDRAWEAWIDVGWQPLTGLDKPAPTVAYAPPSRRCRVMDAMGNTEYRDIVDCLHFEPMAVWEATHVEDRIRDHYLGRNNRWLQMLKKDWPSE